MRIVYFVGDTVQDIHTKRVGIVTARQPVPLSRNMIGFHYTVRDAAGEQLYYMESHALVPYHPNYTDNKPKE